ncbi:F-box protein At4g00755-like isoform X6 [Lycium barbarum]|uniref:F-box protein At4g00755-like isoform X6 n=1 Tax=Lycium barbarum TaxID=112863 RepID=UPI00293F7495|nr:F-box protein At4g00755-like isoform X6 [Lycium barbarum]
MDTRVDFVQRLGADVSLNILLRLNDPADVVRAASVSCLWHQFVATNGISKQLCLRKFPQLSRIARITEPGSASSTDHYPDESIVNTLVPRDRYQDLPSYWSSIGHSDPNASKTLVYKLKADLCVITEIKIQPFKVYFHHGKPICSANSVRFRLGHPKSSRDKSDLLHLPQQQPADDKFIWTYTSEEFPMRQENRLQQFKLPESVLCIGGYLQIELLGIAERCDIDDLFYICIRHVKVRGKPLSPAFGVQNVEPSGDFVLEYKREVF